MNTKTYDKEKITAYLLGALDEEEAEHYDELSFIDDEFADELKTAEKDLIDAYANGELSGTTLEQFENYYLASPLRREKVEFARAFQDFAGKKLAEKSTEIPAVREEKTKRSFGEILSDIFRIPHLSLQWGFALAALALMFFGVWLVGENSRLRDEMSRTQANQNELQRQQAELAEREKQLQDEVTNQRSANSETEKQLAQIREERAQLEQELKKRQSQQQQQIIEQQRAAAPKQPAAIPSRQLNIASFILSPSLRGNNELQTISLPPKTDSVAMRLQLESADYAAYRVILKNQSNGQILWRGGKFEASGKGENKSLRLSFPANLLKSGVYSLEVTGTTAAGAAEIISDYSFRVVQ